MDSSGRVVGSAEIARDLTTRRQERRDKDTILGRLWRKSLEERIELARNLYDHAGQQMAALSLGLRAIESHVESSEGRVLIERLHRQIDEASKELHRVVIELRPAALADEGLSSALQTMLDEWSRRTQITVDYGCEGPDIKLPVEVEMILFRMVQESLTNIVKHAKEATEVTILLKRSETEVQLIVRDDGPGLALGRNGRSRSLIEQGKFGLAGMRERVALVGGYLETVGAPGVGTTLSATIPLRGRPS